MTKLWNYIKKTSKTIHQLTKEFPEKTYRQLEKYRDADRQEEAQRIITQQENEELKLIITSIKELLKINEIKKDDTQENIEPRTRWGEGERGWGKY